ncbi:MAG: glycosyl transferase family 2 [Frankiales bacterium]|nr:glycosyl transferase family 2 [Frankiales bacterium]
MRSEPSRTTVVVVNWNGERWLRPCLDALTRQQAPFPYDVWVVDNASTDGSVALVEREYPHVRLLRNAENLGFAGGNNTALRQVTTPYAVLLNNDATPEPDWLEQLLAPFDAPGNERLAAVTSKVVFAPRFLPLQLSTEGFTPGGADPRELGVRIGAVVVDGEDVTSRVLWERLTWGPEGEGAGRFFWTRPSGEMLVPLPSDTGPWEVTVRWAADRAKDVQLSWDGGDVTCPASESMREQSFTVPAGASSVDVVNNVGSVVSRSGYGADRGYQDVDAGQYDEPAEVFALCGCAVAFRTEAGRQLDWFDDDFFLYYEDTDLSWRLRAAGWQIRYEPTAVVRHVHAASSVEWSPTFMFHTDRNRLLMLVKNATAGRALRECGRYPLTTGSIALRTVRTSLRAGSRPAVRPTLIRLKVLLSFLRLLPTMLAKRGAVARDVPRRTLEQWLVAAR